MAITEGRHGNDVVGATPSTTAPVTGAKAPADYVWGVARIVLGWTFLWAFIDKLFGLGFATPSARSWLNGGSPTTGFLKGTKEMTFGGLYSNLAGQAWVDWLFMIGLLGLGLALILGIGLRVAAVSGSLLLLMMWSAEIPLEQNPIVDEHIFYLVALIGFALMGAGRTLGIGTWWENTSLVRRFPILK